jgi:hypothetical protein
VVGSTITSTGSRDTTDFMAELLRFRRVVAVSW